MGETFPLLFPQGGGCLSRFSRPRGNLKGVIFSPAKEASPFPYGAKTWPIFFFPKLNPRDRHAASLPPINATDLSLFFLREIVAVSCLDSFFSFLFHLAFLQRHSLFPFSPFKIIKRWPSPSVVPPAKIKPLNSPRD